MCLVAVPGCTMETYQESEIRNIQLGRTRQVANQHSIHNRKCLPKIVKTRAFENGPLMSVQNITVTGR